MRFSRQTVKNMVINFLIFFSVYLAVHFYQIRNTPSGSAPEIVGYSINNTMFADLKTMEKPVLVHFWATWCKVCEFEHGTINQISQDFSVIGIASQSGSLTEVKTYMEDHGITYPVVLDSKGANSRAWGIVGYPTSFVIGENNSIDFVEVGFTTEWGIRFRLWLASIF